MANDGDGALFIALNTLVAMLDEKGLISEREFIEALQREQKGRTDGLKSVLQQMIVRMTPEEPPAMVLIDGGKPDIEGDNTVRGYSNRPVPMVSSGANFECNLGQDLGVGHVIVNYLVPLPLKSGWSSIAGTAVVGLRPAPKLQRQGSRSKRSRYCWVLVTRSPGRPARSTARCQLVSSSMLNEYR